MTAKDSREGAPRLRPIVLLGRIMRTTGLDKALVVYVIFLLICCGLFCLLEPETFPNFGSAIWCMFQMITTIGFGDVVPANTACRVIAMLAGLSSLVVVGFITGTVVNFYNEIMSARRKESFMEFGHKLEHLSELPPEDLKDMEGEYKAFKARRH